MMSAYMSQIIGLYLLVMGMGMWVNAKRLKGIIKEVIASPALLFLSGVLALIVGILIVLNHNVWQLNISVLVTLIGWLALISGIMRVIFPQVAINCMLKLIENAMTYRVVALIVLLLGLILSYQGFFTNAYGMYL